MAEIVLALDEVSKTFDGANEVHALSSIDLTVPRGQRVAIMGPSGSGKSTLLNLVCGLDVPTSGRIFLDGTDLAQMSDDDRTRLRREKVGMIFQTFNLIPTLSAVENVALPLRLAGVRARSSAEQAAEMLRRVGLSARLDHRPDEMSGGERQRVAIARALVFGPSILLADEPTGNLDSHTGDEVLGLLDELHNETNTTILLVTHNEHAAVFCDRHITIHDGRIERDELKNG